MTSSDRRAPRGTTASQRFTMPADGAPYYSVVLFWTDPNAFFTIEFLNDQPGFG